MTIYGRFQQFSIPIPHDAVAFKALLRGISQKVAEASTEGGLLGLGGVRVSDAEKAIPCGFRKGPRHDRIDQQFS